MGKFLILIVAILAMGCDGNVLTDQNNSTIDDVFDNDSGAVLSFTGSYPTISSINAPNYSVSGTCDPNNGDVTVTIGSPDQTERFMCDDSGVFEGTLDITGVTLSPASITAVQGGQTIVLSPLPLNDQNGPASAPVAMGVVNYVGGPSAVFDLPIDCNEAGEVVTITGSGLDPNPQTYTCSSAGLEDFPLTFTSPIETGNPNDLTISSTDALGNPADVTTVVSVPIDTQGPVVSVVAGSNIVQGQMATYTINISDIDLGAVNYSVVTSGAENGNYTCTVNPCSITTNTISNFGALTLTVNTGVVLDQSGNANALAASDSLDVIQAGALAFVNPLPTLNTQNSNAYPVNGSCDEALGDVTVTIGTPNVIQTFPCVAPGSFSGNMPSLAGVSSNPVVATVSQGVNTTNANPQPVNDQTPIINAPTIADQALTSGTDTDVSVTCTEVGEVVTFTGVKPC